jgi:hypothetical protein
MIVQVAKTYQVSSQTFKICDRDIPIYLKDVGDIEGLPAEGNDVDEYIRRKKSSEAKTVQTELFQRYADANKKLELRRLENMILDPNCQEVDFKGGLILAPTTVPTLHYSYIHLVENVSLIGKFNWARFSLNHLLDSCHCYITQDESSLKGNLFLLQVSSSRYNQHLQVIFIFYLTCFLHFYQCWYWERIIIEDSSVKYKNEIQPRIAMWNESAANARMNAFKKKGVHGGTVSFQTLHPYDVVLTRTN